MDEDTEQDHSSPRHDIIFRRNQIPLWNVKGKSGKCGKLADN